MTPDPTLIEQVARKLAMFLFETWGDAEGVVWANLTDKERATAFKAAEAAIATLQGSAALPSDEYLLLASYCGHDNAACTEARPCGDCLAMCNVFDGKGTFLREFDPMRATTPTAPDQQEPSLSMCEHGADRGSYCGYCGDYSKGAHTHD